MTRYIDTSVGCAASRPEDKGVVHWIPYVILKGYHSQAMLLTACNALSKARVGTGWNHGHLRSEDRRDVTCLMCLCS
jgi:hypothetical protein